MTFLPAILLLTLFLAAITPLALAALRFVDEIGKDAETHS